MLLVFALCGVGGVAASEALVPDESYFGTYGAALGAARRLGRARSCSAAASGVTTRPTSSARPSSRVVLVLMPLAVDSSMLVAGFGLVIGALCGFAARGRQAP